jgi:hypothetical protein
LIFGRVKKISKFQHSAKIKPNTNIRIAFPAPWLSFKSTTQGPMNTGYDKTRKQEIFCNWRDSTIMIGWRKKSNEK